MTPVWLTILVAVVGLITGAVGSYVALRKDRRDERAQAATERSQAVIEAKTTIELLEKQNALLEKQLEEAKRQGEDREREWRAREEDWKAERSELKKRVDELERDYRSLVLTVTTMGFCANSVSCPEYNPGDRRGNAHKG